MKEGRLFSILYYLLSNGRTTAADLAHQFEVSIRTIYRDVDALSSAGIPICTTTGRGGGIKLLDNHILKQAFLSAEEKEKILLSLQSTAQTLPSMNDATILKLKALFQVEVQNWLEIDFSEWHKASRISETFQLVKDAIMQRIQIEFNYINGNGRTSRKIVQPVKLLFKSNAWYVQAFCTEKEDFRTYKINRIKEISYTEIHFGLLEVPQTKSITEHEFVHLVLHFSKAMMYRVYDEFDDHHITLQSDGSGIVSADMPNKDWLIRYLLSFGSHIKVLSPKSVQDKFLEEAKMIVHQQTLFMKGHHD